MMHAVKTITRWIPPFALLASMTAAAQWSPTRPVRLIAPFPPGGTVDVIGRIVASRLPERLGQQVVVDNRGGANAIIGTDLAARAAPDGHTILIVPIGHSITPSVTKKLPYDTLKDFAPIGLIGNGAYVLVVNPAVPAKSVSEFVALAKSRAGGLNYAFTGHGNATHLAGELFKVLLEIERRFEFGWVSHGDGSLYLRGQACIIALEPTGAKCALRYAFALCA